MDRTPCPEIDLERDEGSADTSRRGRAARTHMTDDHRPDRSISSAEEFEAALAAVVEAAIHADVDVRGAWEFETGGSTYDWEVQIVELARDLDADREEEKE
ncbi:hypothetical protein L593_10590 [Salinarchaeum sp. Harcht-Bsk1]|uniref:hypothetical protein n=1 Tax=Salinarchaeum sp. Harcht-Bsk1 TaxID=1333523 RepID=UPI0003423591|nr:hypothetical protein [Salinarchaeum sp. Harcht-Bsk1]AGN02063.1 hypothetical protein L593_10590 [Salinarchaeum sp. Harcht-Bsk1]